LRKLLPAVVLALVLASPAHGQSIRRLLMPGVAYTRQVEFTIHGPVAIHVLNAPRPTGLYALKPVLSNNAIVGREKVTSMERRASASATVAGVNGDLFNWSDGHPSGVLLRSGVLDSPPSPDRSSVGIGADGTLRVDRVSYAGNWRGTGQRRPLRLNQPPGPNGVTLYTPAWGATTPTAPDVVEAVLPTMPATAPNTDLSSAVAQIGSSPGGTRIPSGGAILAARGSGAARLAEEAPVGTTLLVRLTLTPDWAGVADAVGGGPLLVRKGKPVFRANEAFSSAQLGPRNPRTAVGQLADGRIVLVAVDGRQRGYSVGMTNFELAQTLVRLGCVTGSALDAGGSTTMAFDGQLLNRPSDPGGERAVANALLVNYYGVYAAPPEEPVLSPNGDGVDERQALAYKVVRASTVTAALVGPDGVSRPLFSGPRPAGTQRFTWSGTTSGGSVEPEGRWRFTVTAVDDLGRTSSTDRLFALNTTLGGLSVSSSVLVRRAPSSTLKATFTLAHPALVRVTVERPSGAVVRTIFRRSLPEGPATVVWDGRDESGVRAFSGVYRFHVRATNDFGDVDLTAPFSARRG
jgi:Phosphodiester glycosidase/FlgD Ig-like domain